MPADFPIDFFKIYRGLCAIREISCKVVMENSIHSFAIHESRGGFADNQESGILDS